MTVTNDNEIIDDHNRVWLAFYKANGPYATYIDKGIAFWTRGPFSHVEIVMKDSTSPTGFTMYAFIFSDEKGFRKKPHTFDKEIYEYKKITVGSTNKLREFTSTIENKDYDLTGIILSQFLPIGIDKTDKWFCSEYATQAIQVAGTKDKRFWYLKPNRIHPNKLALIVGLDFERRRLKYI